MQIENDYLKNEDGIKEVIAKKILKDRKMTYEERLKKALIPAFLMMGLLFAVSIVVLFDGQKTLIQDIGIVLGCAIMSIILIRIAYKTARKGSLYADADYEWVNAYDDGIDEAFNIKYEKGRKALEYRTPMTDDEKKEAKTTLLKLIPFWLSIYVVGLGGLTVLVKYDAETPLLDQVIYGVGCATAFFLIIFAMLVIELYCKYRTYKSSKYDEYVRFYQEHQMDSEDE